MRLFDSLPYLVPGAGFLYVLVAVVVSRRTAPSAVWAVWLLGPVALTIAVATWVGLTLTPGIIPLHRWLLVFTLILAAPAAGVSLVATRLVRRGRAAHSLATLATFAVMYLLGASAASRIVDLVKAVQ